MNTQVSISSLSFGYQPDKLILRDIHLKIAEKQVVAIMGGSGSGKSTLLRLISGQLNNFQGEINVLGQDMSNIREKNLYALRKKMGMLFQFGALYTDLNVFENIAFPLREHTQLSENIIRNIVYLKLNAVGLFGTQDMMPSALSGGMLKRVALARTIALDPQLIMYDEPFTGLDPVSLQQVGKLIRELNDALGVCSIMTTHAIEESLSIVDYVYFIHQGVVRAKGTPDEMRNHSDSLVQQFMFGKENLEPDNAGTNFRYATDQKFPEALLK